MAFLAHEQCGMFNGGAEVCHGFDQGVASPRAARPRLLAGATVVLSGAAIGAPGIGPGGLPNEMALGRPVNRATSVGEPMRGHGRDRVDCARGAGAAQSDTGLKGRKGGGLAATAAEAQGLMRPPLDVLVQRGGAATGACRTGSACQAR